MKIDFHAAIIFPIDFSAVFLYNKNQKTIPSFSRKDKHMKQTTKKLAGLACGLALVLGCGAGTLTASATSVGDVIAHAYAVGLPESDIQACIAQYSGREYTSEQCDQAIAALDNWAKERDNKINEEINKGTTTAAPEENRTTETTAATAAAAAGKTAQTTAPAKKDFLNMTLNEKVEYINSLPADQRNDFVQNMSNEERNSFLKQMKTSDQLDVISAMTDVGKAFGVNFSVDSVSDDAISVSIHDENGNLVGVSTYGNTVEATGIPYTVPVLIGGGAILLASAGLGALLLRSRRTAGQAGGTL